VTRRTQVTTARPGSALPEGVDPFTPREEEVLVGPVSDEEEEPVDEDGPEEA